MPLVSEPFAGAPLRRGHRQHRAKTDAVDAAMLARFGALAELQARPPVSPTLDDMKELLGARRVLVKDRRGTEPRKNAPLAIAQTPDRPTTAPG
jgi:transposase